ncbi:hypothetical protein PCYB_133160 [Plasmodium cynomolgi strain B]|uniref:Trigger factor C-terminal domain-containing protein n=1 Tax=Plasmodium cynomolgi (strain B) TaxID=1120755 RepID=K6VGH8_PLACD|nr:hypothetical protein PCYB_133160 [Plasmodium cynomolgi strain B]GAB68442.1 hypothetical protein PCYB_133160 [Plasmodium cynomolgi strain B]
MVAKLGGPPKVFLLVCFILQHIDAILHLSNGHVNHEKGRSKLSMSFKGRQDIVTGKRGSRFSARGDKYAKQDGQRTKWRFCAGEVWEKKRKFGSRLAMGEAGKEDTPPEEAVQRGGVQRDVVQRDVVQRDVVQRDVVQRGGVQRDGVQTDGVQRDVVQRDGVQTDAVQTDAVQTDGVQREAHQNGRDGKRLVAGTDQDGSAAEREKRQRLTEHLQKELLTIEYIDEDNERSEVQLKVHIKGSLREHYYDMCVKQYRQNKLKENKYEYAYLKDVPINNLINYIKKEDYLDIFLKYVNDDIIRVYQKMKNLHLIGSPRLTNNINHLTINKFNDVYLTFLVDKFPKIKFNKSYVGLPMKVEIPPYEKGSTFREFLKVIKNEKEKENEVIINVDENHKVDWNDDVYVNVCRGWVYNSSNEYHSDMCGFEGEVTNKLETRGEKSSQEEASDDTTLNEALKSRDRIKELIDIDKTEEEFINSEETCDEKKAEKCTLQNDETLFNDTNMKDMEECKYYDEFLQSSKFTKYFKEGYQLPMDVISMNGEVITVKENYNPLGLNESLIGLSRNEKKNITAYLPVDLFKAHFDSFPPVADQKNCEESAKVKDIDKESISKFREVIYTEIKKLKSRSFFRKLEDILKSNQGKFFDREKESGQGTTSEAESGQGTASEAESGQGTASEATTGEGNCRGVARHAPEMQDIEFILNDNSPLYDVDETQEEDEEEARSHQQSESLQKHHRGDEADPEEEAQFNKNFDKYLEELLKDDINSLDEKLHGRGATSKTEDILRNVYDPSEYEKCEEGNAKGGISEQSDDEEMLNDYILGKCDLVKCILEVQVLDIKSRKKNEQDMNDYVKKKYNKTIDELHDEVEERAMKDIQNKCVDQRRMEAYKKLMEISSLNVPTTLFRAQGKILYNSYLKKKKMQSSENDKNEKVLSFEEFINKSQKEIYDQVKFSFIVKTIFQNAKLKVNYDDVIKDVLKTLLKTPTNNVQSLIKKIHTIHQAQCVLDFVSVNGDLSFTTNNNSSVNFSVTMKKGSNYTKEEFLNADEELEDAQAGPRTGEVSPSRKSPPCDEGRGGIKDTCGNTPNGGDQKGKQKIFNFTDESNFVVENKKENSEQVELEYFTFKKGANYTRYFEEKYKKK